MILLSDQRALRCVVAPGNATIGDKSFPVENVPDGLAVAFVRPHDIVLQRPEYTEPSADATLTGTAKVRLVTALGPKAWVELVLNGEIIAADISRETLQDLSLKVGSECTVQLRLSVFLLDPGGQWCDRGRDSWTGRIKLEQMKKRHQVAWPSPAVSDAGSAPQDYWFPFS